MKRKRQTVVHAALAFRAALRRARKHKPGKALLAVLLLPGVP